MSTSALARLRPASTPMAASLLALLVLDVTLSRILGRRPAAA
jgi:hypothetical protein